MEEDENSSYDEIQKFLADDEIEKNYFGFTKGHNSFTSHTLGSTQFFLNLIPRIQGREEERPWERGWIFHLPTPSLFFVSKLS